MMRKAYRLSFAHLAFYLSTFVIISQLWSVWKQSPRAYFSFIPSGWDFDADVHSNVHTLTNEQCDIAFPKLYHRLDEAVQRRQGRKVHVQDIQITEGRCMVRVMIYQGELFVVDAGKPEKCYVANGNERERILGTLAQIDRALATTPSSDSSIPNIEFSLSLDDLPRRSKGKGTFFGYTRKDGRAYDDVWLMPNYAYWSWNYTHAPSWNSIRREIADAEQRVPWEHKDPRVVWRGKVKMAKLRSELVKVSKGKEWSDIKPVVINNPKDKHTKDVMNLREFCGYKFTVQTEGTSYSGRLKYLQLCRSAIITHPLVWQEFHTHLMSLAGPDINFIEASENFGNLDSAMEYYRAHDSEAEEIARNSYEMFARRYLTPAAVTCYWRRLFWTWSSVQGFEPQLYVPDEHGNQVMRATPWTAFAANWPHDPAKIP
ncbi:glycosyl transferase family 90-domain-containing protein [Massariosphaeria phaeospora]|uniref:Glycosyl transferase family 90-domain-containing protein n=1 Tax=Massariosphaeria phaeospora TaxID=100035 RepID=A0A7C8I8U4_9PLEO|nr:glycosyl transferase family 90-domain-containing protein [Massariosphaeria phaeospora]